MTRRECLARAEEIPGVRSVFMDYGRGTLTATVYLEDGTGLRFEARNFEEMARTIEAAMIKSPSSPVRP